jgi:hypothetical protein
MTLWLRGIISQCNHVEIISTRIKPTTDNRQLTCHYSVITAPPAPPWPPLAKGGETTGGCAAEYYFRMFLITSKS